MNLRLSASLAAAVVVLALAPAGDAASGVSFRYVVGVYQERTAFVQGACTSSYEPWSSADLPLVVGGACDVRVGPGTWLVTVTDDVLGPWPFSWDAFSGSAPDVTCRLAGSADGSVAITLPEGCHELDVYVHALGNSGVITVAPA